MKNVFKNVSLGISGIISIAIFSIIVGHPPRGVEQVILYAFPGGILMFFIFDPLLKAFGSSTEGNSESKSESVSKIYQAAEETSPQLKKNLPDLSEEITGCVKCGDRNFEHDSYFDEYNCKNCGWISKEKPRGKVNIMELHTKDDVQSVISKKDEKFQVIKEEEEHLAEQLEVGMSLDEIVDILGPPTVSMGGGEVVNMTQNVGASGSGSLVNMMGGKTFTEWDKPEGIYKLVIENNRLARIFSVPDKTVELGDVTIRVEEDMPDKNTKAKCDMCNDSFEENVLLEVGIQDAITGQIKELKVCFKCHTKIVEQASGMYTR